MTQGSTFKTHDATTYSVEVNPTNGDWVHILRCDSTWSDQEFSKLVELSESVVGLANVRLSLNRRDIFVDYWDQDLCEQDIIERTGQLLWQLDPQEDLTPTVVFSHQKVQALS
jgi:hypothetical protein